MQTNLNTKQKIAAQNLAIGCTGRQASQIVKVNPATLSAWRQLPQFQTYLSHLIIQTEKNSIETLYGLRYRAIEKLGELLDANPALALRAAIAILQTTQQQYIPKNPTMPSVDQATWQEMLKVIETVGGNEIKDKEIQNEP